MTLPKIIGLLGPAGSGKSTVAAHLAATRRAEVISFAGPLKEIVRLAFDLEHEQVYGTQEQKEATDPRYNVSARWLMQRVATEGVRAVLGESFWTDLALRRAQDLLCKQAELVVIDDVRFIDEVLAIRDRGGKIMRLVPPGGRTFNDLHRSETEMAEVEADWTVSPPRKSVEELCGLVDEVLG